MWLSGRFGRRRDHRDATTEPTPRPALWAEVALPPPLEPAAWSPADEPIVESFAPVLVGSRTSVRLGFVDGSSYELADESGESEELRRVAGVIMGDRSAG